MHPSRNKSLFPSLPSLWSLFSESRRFDRDLTWWCVCVSARSLLRHRDPVEDLLQYWAGALRSSGARGRRGSATLARQSCEPVRYVSYLPLEGRLTARCSWEGSPRESAHTHKEHMWAVLFAGPRT
jgi:hypothetical protein